MNYNQYLIRKKRKALLSIEERKSFNETIKYLEERAPLAKTWRTVKEVPK